MIILLWNFINLKKNNMKQIIIKDQYLYYTEVQIEKVNFWFIANDPFIVQGSKYMLYHCKECTLAKALEYFYNSEIQPMLDLLEHRRNRRSRSYTADPTLASAMFGAVASNYLKKLSEEKPDDNINAV